MWITLSNSCSLIYTSKNHNNGIFKQGVPNNKYHQDKQTPAPSSIQSPPGVNDKLQDLSHTLTPVNCSTNAFQSDTYLSIMLRQ